MKMRPSQVARIIETIEAYQKSLQVENKGAGVLGAQSLTRPNPRAGLTLAVPDNMARILIVFENNDALNRFTALGATLVEFDLEPFYETARLLYEGPWVAERYLVIRDLLASSPDPVEEPG